MSVERRRRVLCLTARRRQEDGAGHKAIVIEHHLDVIKTTRSISALKAATPAAKLS